VKLVRVIVVKEQQQQQQQQHFCCFGFGFGFCFCFWKLQNMCYEKQASEAKAKQRKYCRDVRTANQPAFHMATGLLLFSFGWLY
jgi:hypothetical protein